MAEQTERSYQKQPTIFQNTKWQTLGIGKKSTKRNRYYKSIGLGFKTPREVS
jgi:small subunit ribosomal protein S11e